MPIDRDSETGEYYEVENPPTWQDWVFGGCWTVVGIVGLACAHIEGKLRTLRGW